MTGSTIEHHMHPTVNTITPQATTRLSDISLQQPTSDMHHSVQRAAFTSTPSYAFQ
ncbi:hypothetical protein TanjilG_11126 [Lupinus angustifolius]|uniref:Uncharacterized protein n=1 Tax=Lupinus angustifolius TaxID=3871 RepID=A0A394DJE7_LUPAN|nr:hypothetical protein TanjilG_11126 [Lupinus angustifolius]